MEMIRYYHLRRYRPDFGPIFVTDEEINRVKLWHSRGMARISLEPKRLAPGIADRLDPMWVYIDSCCFYRVPAIVVVSWPRDMRVYDVMLEVPLLDETTVGKKWTFRTEKKALSFARRQLSEFISVGLDVRVVKAEIPTE